MVNGDQPDLAGTILQRIARVLRSHRVLDFAFTGDVAVGVWAAPRQTKGVDLCGVATRSVNNRAHSVDGEVLVAVLGIGPGLRGAAA